MELKFIKESSLKGFTQISIVEMFHNSPETSIREIVFGEKTVDMWISLEGSAEGPENDTAYSHTWHHHKKDSRN